METSIGIAFNDFVMVATDQTCAQSILMLKNTCEKTYPLTNHLRESGDTTQFAEFMAKNIQLYKMRNAYEMSRSEATNFTRRNLSDYLRSHTPFHVNLLIAAYDKKSDKAELYTMDYLAGMVKTEHASHGYGSIFSSGILDRKYRPDMTVEEDYDLIKTCVAEVQKRLIMNLSNFSVQIIDKEGTKKSKTDYA
ncbi:proteasome subunit beta type-2 [Lepeophtheirus salmonis]|uniref:proteasome subunit beta type-2 n=1 Tax=Lepeophtheirus salmonis TaxID=72036 RepID=UPI001AE81F84|nr:proteasome subunit beta type-2-like [Lepeophtheirus salmonis]